MRRRGKPRGEPGCELCDGVVGDEQDVEGGWYGGGLEAVDAVLDGELLIGAGSGLGMWVGMETSSPGAGMAGVSASVTTLTVMPLPVTSMVVIIGCLPVAFR